MARLRWIAITTIFLGTACSANLSKAPFLTRGNLVEAPPAESSDAQAATEVTPEAPTKAVPMTPEPPQTAEEKVSPPANISGSYLICAEAKAPTDALPEAVVNCGLRDQKTNNKINIDATYASKLWSYQSSANSSATVMIAELPLSLEWHIAVTLKATTLGEVQGFRDSLKLYVSAMNAAGVKFQEWTTVSPMFTQWMALNGAKIPVDSAIGGTEDDGSTNTYVCRMYVGQEILPAKLLPHYNDSSKSICYSVSNGSDIQSQGDDPSNTLYKSDVLRITTGVFDEYYEWIPATNGLKPANAVAIGKDAQGNPLYSCRALHVDGSMPEQTLGLLRPGGSACLYEYYGSKSNSTYQVLAWKDTGTKKIMAARPVN